MAKRLWWSVGVLIVLGFAVGHGAEPAQDQFKTWQPDKTWVFIVGVLEWEKGFGAFPNSVKDRRDGQLVDFFKSKGVPEKQIVYLQDKEATLERIHKSLVELLPKTKEGDLLVLYYAGHGTLTANRTAYFVNYDAKGDPKENYWSIPSIFDAIEKDFKGSRALLAADCCHSGSLAVEAKKRKGTIAYACLSSVEMNCSSTGNWTFTDCLVRGLRGDAMADLNDDGQVTFKELAEFAKGEMAFKEEQMVGYGTTNRFDPDMKLTTTAGKRPNLPPGRYVEVEGTGRSGGVWSKAVIDEVKDGQCKIHYAGKDVYDGYEWVTPDRIRRFRPQALAAETKVEARSSGKWWEGKIVESYFNLHRVRFDGWSEDWDEWAGPRRLREKSEK